MTETEERMTGAWERELKELESKNAMLREGTKALIIENETLKNIVHELSTLIKK